MSHSKGMYQLWSSEQVCKYSGTVKDAFGQVIPTPVEARTDSDRIIEFWQHAVEEGWGFRWAVLLISKGEAFAGHVGFNSLSSCAELAFHLHPDFWGQGVMAEASQLAMNWVQERGASEVEAFIEPENAASIALASRLGMSATEQFVDGAQRYVLSLK